MANYKKKLLKISKGQIADGLIERTDVGLLDSSGQVVSNFVNSIFGSLVSVPGSTIKHIFGQNKTVKMFKIDLADGTDSILVINITDRTMQVFSSLGVGLGSAYSIPSGITFTVAEKEKIHVAQNNDLILIASPSNPLLKLDVSNLGVITGLSVYDIDVVNILKVSNFVTSAINPIVIRITPNAYPNNPEDYNIGIGDICIVNQTGNPNTNFPWSGKRLDRIGSSTEWNITSATINNAGNISAWTLDTATIDNVGDGDYLPGDIVTTEDGRTWELPDPVALGESLIAQQSTDYTSDPSGTGQTTTGGTGTGLTITRTATGHTGYQNGDVIKIANGAKFTYNNGALTVNAPNASYSTNPAGTGLATTGGSGTGMTIDVVSANVSTLWTAVSYTPSVGDYCYNQFNNTYWLYNGSTWTQYTSANASDITQTITYQVSATSGTIDVTLASDLKITKPTSYVGTAEQYAKKVLIGIDFDGEDGMGVMRITGIEQSTRTPSTNTDFYISKLSGNTWIAFLKAATNYPSFTLKLSERPAFDSGKPSTVNNLYGTQNYPLNIFFYQQRLFIAGTVNNPTQLLASNLGVYNDFSDDYSGASTNSFQLVIAGTEKEVIQNVLLNQGLQIFTNQSEWVSADASITQTSGFVRNSQIGSTYATPIITANGTTIFCPKHGVGIVGFIYNQDNASFNTPHISMLTSVFTSQIANMNLRKGYTVKDDILIYMALEDGNLVIANYLADQEIQAFITRSSENTSFKQCMQVENNMIYLVERNGYLVLELEDSNKNTAISYNSFTYNSTTGVISGLPALYNGLKINVYNGSGKFVAQKTVSSNKIQLDTPYPTSVSEVGLNIHSEFVSNPQNINEKTFSLYKTIRTVKLALKEENNADFVRVNGKVGRNKDNFITYIRPVKPLRKCQFNITNDVYKINILSIEIELEA